MTRQEKYQLHIQEQNKRMWKLIWKCFKPVFYALLLALPLLLMGLKSLTVQPLEPVEVTYIDCYQDHRAVVLYTEEYGEFMVSRYLREDFLRDAENGVLKPGDRLTITDYPWTRRNGIAAATCGERTYGDLQSWRESQKKDWQDVCMIGFVFLILGLIGSGYVCSHEREEFAEIRQLKHKYKSRL